MRATIPSAGKPFQVDFMLQSAAPQAVRIVAWDIHNPNTKYYDRVVNMRYEPRPFTMSFPLSPDIMAIRIMSTETQWHSDDRSLQAVNVKYKPMITRNCSINEDSRLFSKFAKGFAAAAGYLPLGVYQSKPSGRFKIIFEDVIRNRETGAALNTPATITHDTGILKVSQQHFKYYTIPQRYLILLHECGHKYINPSIGADIGDETAADLGALYIYLCEGFPKIDARTVFSDVFLGADNDLNRKRMAIIEDFITRFEKGEIK